MNDWVGCVCYRWKEMTLAGGWVGGVTWVVLAVATVTRLPCWVDHSLAREEEEEEERSRRRAEVSVTWRIVSPSMLITKRVLPV